MKANIHPKWYSDAKVVCLACGTEWITGGSVKELRVDVCSNCHPFYTGEQRIVDTEGQVDRFMKRLRVREQHEADSKAKQVAKANADIPLEDLEINKRYVSILNDAGMFMVSDILNKLENEGDEAILSLPGLGVKVLADAKRRISERGYTIKVKQPTEE